MWRCSFLLLFMDFDHGFNNAHLPKLPFTITAKFVKNMFGGVSFPVKLKYFQRLLVRFVYKKLWELFFSVWVCYWHCKSFFEKYFAFSGLWFFTLSTSNTCRSDKSYSYHWCFCVQNVFKSNKKIFFFIFYFLFVIFFYIMSI